MVNLGRILSRPTAKPHRTGDLKDILDDGKPYLNHEGHVDFAPGDIENPHNWSTPRRWYVTFAAVTMVVNATFASSAPSGALESISAEFGVSDIAAGLTITLFLLGYCAGPLLFAPLSEFYGRRWIFYGTFILYFAFNFLCAWAPNFGSLLVGRFLTGTFVSAPLSNSPGVLADLWDPVERGNAMAAFSCMVWVGPSLGPVIAGFLELTENWRWSFYVVLWMAAGTILIMFTLPETFGPTILVARAKRIRKAKIPGYEDVQAPVETMQRSIAETYKIALTRPWILLFDPISFLCAVYMSIVYTLLYMLFTIYPIVFEEHRGWNVGVGELPLIGVIIGSFVGSVVVVFDSKHKAKKIAGGGKLEPEDRLPLAMIGGVGFAVTMFWFAWTANFNSIHWIVPTIAGVFLAASIMLIFVGYLNYLVDAYLTYAASAIAANTVARSACGAAAPLFTNQMFDAMGIGGGGSLIGGVAAVMAVVPFAFYKWGAQIRRRSRFAPTEEREREKVDDEERQQRRREGQGAAWDTEGTDETVEGTSSSSSDGAPVRDAEGKRRESQDDDVQNALGEPRQANTNFGREATE